MCYSFQIDCIEKHPCMHTLIIFTRSRLQGHAIFFLKTHLESLQELVLKKIFRAIFNENYVILSVSAPETFLRETQHIFS